MTHQLQGKVAIVTGGGQGIGAGIARRFAQAGARVLVATRTAANGKDVVQQIHAEGGTATLLPIDIGTREGCERTVAKARETYGQVDIVVHNAAVYPVIPIESLQDKDLDTTLSVNLKACFWLVQAALPHLRRQGGGRFLFTSSVTGPQVAMPGTAHYAASKAGMNGFIRTAALEFARQNITVNGVEPGYIRTTAMEALGDAAQLEEMARSIPMGKLGVPADIAGAMLFLASDDAAYITGQTIVVDGGSTLPESPAVLDAYYRQAR